MSDRYIFQQDQRTGKLFRVTLNRANPTDSVIDVIDDPQFRRVDENTPEFGEAMGSLIVGMLKDMAETGQGGNDATS